MSSTHNSIFLTNADGSGTEYGSTGGGSGAKIKAVFDTSPATKAHSAGEILYYDSHFYKASTAIAIGDTLSVGTNLSTNTGIAAGDQVFVKDIKNPFVPPEGSTVTPTDDIQTWLKCASITDKSYTTISEVLADSSTLATLISSQNAVDYMVRSTSWATTVCANQTAMSLIGLNNYAANTLLADSTWLNAICNSTYFESVLNVKVPTMTSNTTPSGEASASRTFVSYYPYKAFDNDDNTDWLTTNQSYTSGDWIQYMFVNPVCVKKVSFFDTPSNGVNRTKDYNIKASNDGQSWDVIQTGTLPSTNKRELVNIPLENNNSYKYWRLTSISAQSANAFEIFTLQFYGREDV